MKKLLFIIDSLNCGGAEKSLVSLLPLLDKQKYEIHLWILQRGGVFETLLPDDVILESNPEYSIPEQIVQRLTRLCYSIIFRVNRLFGVKKHPSELLWQCVGITYKVPDQQYDIAVAYQQGIPTYILASKIKACRKVAWINADISKVGYSKSFNIGYYQLIDRIVPVSNELSAIIRRRYPEIDHKCCTVYDILNPELIRSMAVERFDCLSDSNLFILTVGRMVPLKGYDIAVDAAKYLRDRGLRFVWLFVGDGPCRKDIEDKISNLSLTDYVKCVGMKENPYPYIANCDIYVQSSLYEGFGLTLAEAKILNKPIVSTDFDVVHDQLTNGVNGLIVPKNGEDIADAVQYLIYDKELKCTIIENLKKENNTTYKTEIKKVERIFDEN